MRYKMVQGMIRRTGMVLLLALLGVTGGLAQELGTGEEPSTYRPKGYRGFVDFSSGYIVDAGNRPYISISTSHGYQFNPYFFLGAGLGLEYNSDMETFFMPLFADFRVNFINKRVSPYIDLRGGYSPLVDAGAYLSFSTGVSIQFKPKFGLYAGLSYTMQQAKETLSSTHKQFYYMHYLGAKVGLEF